MFIFQGIHGIRKEVGSCFHISCRNVRQIYDVKSVRKISDVEIVRKISDVEIVRKICDAEM